MNQRDDSIFQRETIEEKGQREREKERKKERGREREARVKRKLKNDIGRGREERNGKNKSVYV